MTRMEEYQALQQALQQTPPALDGSVERARRRAGRRLFRRRIFGVPAASLAALFAVFVVLVNVCVPFAYACGSVPALRTLVQAVSFNPSLKAAL